MDTCSHILSVISLPENKAKKVSYPGNLPRFS